MLTRHSQGLCTPSNRFRRDSLYVTVSVAEANTLPPGPYLSFVSLVNGAGGGILAPAGSLQVRNDWVHNAYVSRITPTAPASFTNVFHPAEPFEVRFSLERTFSFR